MELMGRYVGDTAAGSGMQVDYIAELVHTTRGEVYRLDSFTVAPGVEPYRNVLVGALDLLSGTYVVRLRMEPHRLQVAESLHGSRYPVSELTSYVEQEDGLAKVRRIDRTGSAGRVSAWPNPATAATEIRFSVPVSGMASVLLYDATGREMLRIVDRTMMEQGRYSLMVDLSGLPSGTYLLELRYDTRTGGRRAVEKVVIYR